jgi:hypothetical protein
LGAAALDLVAVADLADGSGLVVMGAGQAALPHEDLQSGADWAVAVIASSNDKSRPAAHFVIIAKRSSIPDGGRINARILDYGLIHHDPATQDLLGHW